MYRIKDGALLIKITALLFFHVVAKDEICLYDIFRSAINIDLLLSYCFILVVSYFVCVAMAQ
ncbi:TPA_asm: hypothetical protein G0B27_00695 [Salmonella enterica subsp. indica]|uniref:Uncharacterized protein n=2 Tax=Salmonella enterica TaxID=28901 RepID=A0A701Z9Y9_SALER|nr:hypothetical protein SEI61121_03235 [Salmonella enterica subsp. indica serovar 6,14,25:z10:1,(2),7 str. 1121]HAC6572814.1 hypothetical protein [Salmonella enterica subsp. indica]